jgi:hypothetical protein
MISKEFFLSSEPVSGDDPPSQVVAPPPLSSSLPRTGSSLPRTGSFRSTARLIFPKQSVETASQPKPTQSRFGFKSTWGGANSQTKSSRPDDVAAPANGSRAASIKPAAIGRAASASQLPGRGGGGVASSAKGVEISTSSVTSSTLSRSTVSTSRLVSSKVVLSPKPITEEPPPRSSPKPGRSGNVFDGRNNSPKLGQGESRNSPQNGRRDSPKDLLRNSPRFQRRGGSPSSSPTSSSKPGESHIPITCVRDPEPHIFGPSGSGSISQR